MSDRPSSSRRYMSVSEYAEIQKEAGSCIPQFKESMTRASKFGLIAGIPFGMYVGYRHHPHALKPFVGKSIATTLYTCATFSAVGLIISTYNCLRVYT